MSPGFKRGHGGFCYNKYSCPHESHRKFKQGHDILVCDAHKNDPRNSKLLQEYKTQHITDQKFEEFSKNITISLHIESVFSTHKAQNGQFKENVAIYMLQTIEIQGKKINLFFDSGCSDLVCKRDAVDYLSGLGSSRELRHSEKMFKILPGNNF